MRVIIEIEEGGSGSPEVVLRTTSRGAVSPGAIVPGAEGDAGGIDAGPAPSPGAGSQAEGAITTPAISPAFDPASSHSAGAAPSTSTGG
jgi:hypothetical protein